MKLNDFELKLKHSREAEMSVANWLKKNGYAIIPSYDYTGSNGDKAPKMMTLNDGFPVPDLDVSKEGNRMWIEVKRYTYAPLNRRHQCFVHGISKRLYDSYKMVEETTGCQVYLAIEEEQNKRLLIGCLLKLNPLPCQCGCMDGAICKADIKKGIYFDVNEFKVYESTL